MNGEVENIRDNNELEGDTTGGNPPVSKRPAWWRWLLRRPAHSGSEMPPEERYVEMRGLNLYGLWAPDVPNATENSPSSLPDIWGENIQIGQWKATHLAWQPRRKGKESPWLGVNEIKRTLDLLYAHLLTLMKGSVANGPDIDEVSAYLVVHIEQIQTHVPRKIEQRVRRKQGGRQMNANPIQPDLDPSISLQEMGLRQLLDSADSKGGSQSWALSARYFTHFDRVTRRRGWLVISPSMALLAGTRSTEVFTLASLVQPRDISSNSKTWEISEDRYEAVADRIAQWNGTQDIFQAVAQLEDMVESGRRSTNGQVWLNYALAAIGILLALFAGPRFGIGATIALGLLALASVFHARYANTGTIIWQSLGQLLFAGGVVLGLIVLFTSSQPAPLSTNPTPTSPPIVTPTTTSLYPSGNQTSEPPRIRKMGRYLGQTFRMNRPDMESLSRWSGAGSAL